MTFIIYTLFQTSPSLQLSRVLNTKITISNASLSKYQHKQHLKQFQTEVTLWVPLHQCCHFGSGMTLSSDSSNPFHLMLVLQFCALYSSLKLTFSPCNQAALTQEEAKPPYNVSIVDLSDTGLLHPLFHSGAVALY